MSNSNLIPDVFFLGAGKPASGDKPSALKSLGQNQCALDWQLHSLNAIPAKIHFLGGYHIEEIIQSYPQLHYTVIPDWQEHSVIHTLLAAPLRETTSWFLYADTLFRPALIQSVAEIQADIVIVYDSHWKSRYAFRDIADIRQAEVLSLGNQQELGEFTGLVKFSPMVIQYLLTLQEKKLGTRLIDLIQHLTKQNFQIATVDAKGDWAEFNSPRDIAHFILGTKAETLSRLAPVVKHSVIGKQICFTVNEWRQSSKSILSSIQQTFDKNVIIRSSAKSEDNWQSSKAGGHASLLNINVQSTTELTAAIEQVIFSYQNNENEQVLVQEFLAQVKCAGVVFTRILETGSPYYRINYDDHSSSTDSVTSGNSQNLQTVLISLHQPEILAQIQPALMPVLEAVQELENLLGFNRLDIEFAIDQADRIHIFQVRPITVDHSEYEIADEDIFEHLQLSIENFQRLQASSPFVLGDHTLLGIMPDWNPAEIIGTRPKPMAFSLYRFLITNDVWATQRAQFAYRDVRPQALLVACCGRPYVDIRASLNSFVPASVSDKTAFKLVNAYLKILTEHPEWHDKLEFEVAFTTWTPSFYKDAIKRLVPYGILESEIQELQQGLLEITQCAFKRLNEDLKPLSILEQRFLAIIKQPLSSLDKAILLLEDCKQYGTLAFAHAARAGFIAISFLKSLNELNVISNEEKDAFLQSIKTITTEFEEDAIKVGNGNLSLEKYCERYGHLRPGTYDNTVLAYWQVPECYLFPKIKADAKKSQAVHFDFSANARNFIQTQLQEYFLDTSVDDFALYLTQAIQAREKSKFIFTRNLSVALDQINLFAKEKGFSAEDFSYLQYEELIQLKAGVLSVLALPELISQRKKTMTITKMVELPQLITHVNDFYCFKRYASQPNFITSKTVDAPLLVWEQGKQPDLAGHIILIPQADPGYDWLFAHPIKGLITQYGGANSHMAIRAAEMNLPAAIGVGDKIYEDLLLARHVHLDCAIQSIRGIA